MKISLPVCEGLLAEDMGYTLQVKGSDYGHMTEIIKLVISLSP